MSFWEKQSKQHYFREIYPGNWYSGKGYPRMIGYLSN